VTLSTREAALLAEARTATLATIDPDGRPRLVPICFVLTVDVIWSPLDEKPKAVADVRALARVRDIVARPSVTVLVDRWSEDWSRLAWVRVYGHAALVEPGDVPDSVLQGLRAKYPQYLGHDLESRPLISIAIERVASWGPVSDPG
jgi:PPOX class probable F420-dependent enzyme